MITKSNVGVMRKRKKIPLTPYLWITIPIILMLTFNFYPFIKTVVSSFSITTPYGEFIKFAGLYNWKKVFADPDFAKYMINTFVFGTIALLLSFFVAMFFAILCSSKGKGGRIYQTLFGLPMVLATAPVAAIWRFVFRADAGLMNQLMDTNITWLIDPEISIYVLAVVTAWSHVGSNFIYLLVGFRNVSNDLIEASKIDGAGWLTRTMRIMIPMASPQIFYVLFLNIIWSLKVITQIKLLTGGGPAGATTTLMYAVYTKATVNGQFEYGCCLALILFIIIFVATRVQFAFEKKMVHYQ